MSYLKQSTAITLKIGPFLDDTDGKTAETGLTIAQADVRLSKNGANIAQKTEATSCTHDEIGIYGCPIDATDTATLGRLQLFVHESGALPVWHEYMVLPANVYDSMFSTDKLEVDVTQLLGTAWLTPGVAGTPDINAKLLGGTVQTGNDVGADVDLLLTDTGTTLDALIKDIPTVAEFEARSIVSADYVVVGDTIAGVTAVTNDVGLTQAGADKVWGTAARALTDKAEFTLSTAGVIAIWEKNISAYAGAGYAGTYLKTLYDDWLNGGRLDLIMDIIAADVVNIDGDAMRGTDSAALAASYTATRAGYLDNLSVGAVALASVCTEARLAELAAANLPTDIDAILADTSTDGVVVASGSKTGYALSAAGIDAIIDEVIEGTITLRQAQRLFLAVLGGKSAGGGTATITFRDNADAKNRISATVDASGNRTAITLDGA